MTSDLGESFFAEDVAFLACVIYDQHEAGLPLVRWNLQWKAGMRSLQVQHILRIDDLERPLRLLIAPHEDASSTFPYSCQPLQISRLPLVISAWSNTFGIHGDITRREVERRFELPGGQKLCIREETGESIACHIWYVSIGSFGHQLMTTAKGMPDWCLLPISINTIWLATECYVY